MHACRSTLEDPTATGHNLITGYPWLSELGQHGGPTLTFMPLPGSPAIDQAVVLSPADSTDQRGSPRLLGVRPDLGSVESNVAVVTTAVDELNPPGVTGAGVSLREAVRDVPPGGTVAFDRSIFNGATPSANTIILTLGPLNPLHDVTLDGSNNPGGIRILTQLTITQQPVSVAAPTGGSAAFHVAVTDISHGVGYQWRKDRVNLTGVTTSPDYFVPNAQESDAGVYDVILNEYPSQGFLVLIDITKPPASIRSQPATLTVGETELQILRHPSSAMIALGGSERLRVVAVGPPGVEIAYQWLKDERPIKGAVASSYLISNAQFSQAASYRCRVTIDGGELVSRIAYISVVDATPKVVNTVLGGTFTTSVSAAGNELAYEWHKNGESLHVTSKTLVIRPVSDNDAGLYTCVVSRRSAYFNDGAPTRLNVISTAPRLTKPQSLPDANIGQNYYYRIELQEGGGLPSRYAVSGLPRGMSCDPVTGVISGRPTFAPAADYRLVLAVSNARGSDRTTATLHVNALPASVLGSFTGLLDRSPVTGNLGGRFDLTTTSAGTFSAALTLGGAPKLSFVARLLQRDNDADAILYGTLPAFVAPDGTPFTAFVEVFVGDDLARLTLVRADGGTLVIPAMRNAGAPHATPYATYYTLRLNPFAGENQPRGHGFASFTVNSTGALTLAGKLPDGSAVSGSTFVGPQGEILLFNLLYGNRGSHIGKFTITPAALVADNTVNGSTSWFKPAALANSTDTVYREGLGTLTVEVMGSSYPAPGRGQLVMGLSAVPSPQINTALGFTHFGSNTEDREFAQLLRIFNPSPNGLTNIAVLGSQVFNSTRLPVLTAATGAFNGRFTLLGSSAARNRTALFYGQIVKIGTRAQGYGYFLLPTVPTGTQTVNTSPKLGGRVVLVGPH